MTSPRFTRKVEVSIDPTIEEIAEAIIHMGSDEQALLISKMAELAKFSIPMQLQYVTDDECLTNEGRDLMTASFLERLRLIGAYSSCINDDSLQNTSVDKLNEQINPEIQRALVRAECALSDICEGEKETHSTSADNLDFAERRSAEVLAKIRPIMRKYHIPTSEWPPVKS